MTEEKIMELKAKMTRYILKYLNEHRGFTNLVYAGINPAQIARVKNGDNVTFEVLNRIYETTKRIK